jgi:CRP/FNR family transcriptional regulator, cyclic AMP receptor protein
MRTMDQLVTEHPFFAGLDRAPLVLLAGCARNVHVRRDDYLFREGAAANEFYLVRTGRIALELHVPGGGHVFDTVDAGDVVGWSWMVPPHTWFSDARAVQESDLVALDGACLRGKCDADPVLGYALLQRVTQVMLHRLQAARVRLLDLYGGHRAVPR